MLDPTAARAAELDAASPPVEWPVSRPPHEVVVGADGTVWFSHQTGFGRLRPRAQAVEVVELPDARGYFHALVLQSDGILLGNQGAPALVKVRLDPRGKGRLAVRAADVSTVTLPLPSAHGLSLAADGTLWVTGYCSGKVARRDPTGRWHEVAVGGCVEGVAATGDGRAFVADYGANRVHLVDDRDQVRTVSLPSPCHPHTVTVAADGRAFAACHAGGIFELGLEGALKRHAVGDGSLIVGTAADAGGNLWFAAAVAGKIGKLDSQGRVSFVQPASAGGYPFGVAVGPDGSVWYTLEVAGRVGRIAGGAAVIAPKVAAP
ncbi:MAG: hypothetical protein HY903_09250 [Deltaproteobacteria bacterium]|nr:hypothetical protein [Deltaproteobacteria bacterium]